MKTAAAATVVAVLAALVGVSNLLKARDDRVLIDAIALRPPIPSYGAVTTISHSAATMGKITAVMPDLAPEDFVPSFDMYYEAQLTDCDSTKNFAMIGGTNGASHLYHDIIAHFRKQGYCTLNFDHRSHGRSEDPPGELTAELLGEDAAAIIRHVFGEKKVHLLGWSLGGAVSYYLGIKHPDIVKSITLSGMTSCFGKVTADGSCDLGADPLKWFFSRDLMLRLLGTELQAAAAVAAIKMHDEERAPMSMRFWRSLSTSTMTKTPNTWGRWRKEHYHEEIRKITAPCLLIAGADEHVIGIDAASMGEDVKRLQNAEPPLILQGLSHFLWFEEHDGKRGHDQATAAIDKFHQKHA